MAKRFNTLTTISESELNKFKPRLKSAKNRFQLSTGLNLETLNTILVKNILRTHSIKRHMEDAMCIKLGGNIIKN